MRKKECARPKFWSVRGLFLSFIFLVVFVLPPVAVLGGSVAHSYINGKEEWQEERICTVDSASKHTSTGGFRMGGSSQKIIIESPDCGKIFLHGVLQEKTTGEAVRYLTIEETVSYLEKHRGEQFRFYFGKIQLRPLNSDALLAERVELQ